MLNNDRDRTEIGPNAQSEIPSAFSILMVCTANQCRSPLAEFIFRSQCEALELYWKVESSGLRAHPGTPMHPHSMTILAQHALSVGEWSSTRTSAAQVDQADLILTATTAHRGAVVQLQPRALQRTFTLFQFARLAEGVTLNDLARGDSAALGARLVAAARARRSQLQPAGPGEDDLADPIGQPLQAFAETAGLVQSATRLILTAISG
jgi:protein-tyrosine phosphatase